MARAWWGFLPAVASMEEDAVTSVLRMRILDSDEGPYVLPSPRRSFEDALKQALLKTYPVAPVVEDVDDVFVRLLDRMAALELDRTREG